MKWFVPASRALVPLLFVSQAAVAQVTSATGLCNDGTVNTSASKRGACSHHGGVKAAPAPARPVALPPRAPAPVARLPGAARAAAAPVTGVCNDSTEIRTLNKQGACARHGGVNKWYGVQPVPSHPVTLPAGSVGTPTFGRPTRAASASSATGLCGDGTETHAMSTRGACSRHGGVKQWYSSAGSLPTPQTPQTHPTQSRSPSYPPPVTQPSPYPTPRTAPVPAASGEVWVNAPTKVYHCPGDRWYGTTKNGAYMSEAQAQAQGMRPSRGKNCR